MDLSDRLHAINILIGSAWGKGMIDYGIVTLVETLAKGTDEMIMSVKKDLKRYQIDLEYLDPDVSSRH